MKPKGYIALLMFASSLISGCMTSYGTKLDELARERQTGKISETEYQAELKKLRESQPWGTQPEMYNADVPRIRGTASFP